MDQQYSITLGRPLRITSLSEWTETMQAHAPQGLCDYYGRYSILARQTISAGLLNSAQIDHLSDQLVELRTDLPTTVRFDKSWLNSRTVTPPWPSNVQAVVIHQEMHNLLIWVHRQRKEPTHDDDTNNVTTNTVSNISSSSKETLRGHASVLASCREILQAFLYVKSHARAGLICWTVCQQGFNAASIVAKMGFKTQDMADYELVHQAYNAFQEIYRYGIHQLARTAAERLQNLLQNINFGYPPPHRVTLINNNHEPPKLRPAIRNITGNRLLPTKKPVRSESTKSRASKEKPNKKAKLNSTNNGQNIKQKPASNKTATRKDNFTQCRSREGPLRHEDHTLEFMSTFSIKSPKQGHHTAQTPATTSKTISQPVPRHGAKSSSSPTQPPKTNDFHASYISDSSTTPSPFLAHNLASAQKIWPFYTFPVSISQSHNIQEASSLLASPYENYPHYDHSLPASSACPSITSTAAPPSLHAHSYPSSTYANSDPSSLHTPSASYPVSPSLSNSHTSYCVSNSATQPQSPVWRLGGINGGNGGEQHQGIFVEETRPVGYDEELGMGMATGVGRVEWEMGFGTF